MKIDEKSFWLYSEILSPRTEKQGDMDVPVYSVTNEGIFPRSEKFEKTLSKSNSKNKLIYKGDLVFGMSRKILNWGVMEDEIGSVSGAYNVFSINKDKINPLYLKLYMLANPAYFLNVIKPGAREGQGIDKSVLMSKQIPKISLDEQKNIIESIRAFENKITVNNEINKRLNELSQSYFKQWFIDFEFPNREGKPYRSSGGEMKEVNSIEIPKEWAQKKLEDVSEFQNGYAFYKVGYSNEGIKVIDLGNVDIFGNFIETSTDKYISEDIYDQKKMQKYHVKKNDLVIIMTDRKQTMDLLGKVGKITKDTPYILNQRVGRIRANDGINVNFLYSYLNSEKCLNKLKANALGSVQKYVNTGDITGLEIIVPTEDIMMKFSSLINPVFELMEKYSEENFELEGCKNSLLPKLVNGEISITIPTEKENRAV
ncbi:restriction endonuclease subunit S [Ferdinandcohnia sp. SAFN-114]|uniref:restriction endonuclease subunit S n=1 Tax=Ferdinandcohnia sp. SAFN-114 TaxID=3387275 RepID=UPI003F81089A